MITVHRGFPSKLVYVGHGIITGIRINETRIKMKMRISIRIKRGVRIRIRGIRIGIGIRKR